MKKKFLSIAVCLCMIMTMIPGGVLQPNVAWAAEHTSHCVCGGSRAIGDHTEHTDITDWKEWTETTYLPNKAGSYYLTQNVEISEAWEPASGTVLCLNGKNITANGRFDAIDVQASVTFTLTDCEPNSTRGNITHAKDSNNAALSGSGVSVKAGAVFNMYGGNITGNEVTIGGSGVSVEAGADFNMHGGSITKNTALNNIAKGGGVNNYGIFTMTGGTISGNQGGTVNGGGGGGVLNAGTFTMSGTAVIGGTNAEDANIGYDGGGVYNYNTGQFNFNGGTIIGNEANRNGGGVYNEQGSPTFTMTGGIIKKNKAKNGGGVAVNNSANFTMNGGTIGDTNSNDGNTVTNEGGGVCVLSGVFNMNTGNIIGNTAVGSVADEYRGWGGGVYISTGTFTMTGGTISSNRAIKGQGSAGALGAGGGVYNNRRGTFTMSGGNISNNTSDSHGGGVYNSGTFTMSDAAVISGNTVTNKTCYGGGVFNYSSFTMNGGTIGGLNEDDANTAGFGGGLYHGDGEAQLNGGMIQGNIAAKSGGGVFYTKNITLKNVTITGNTANEDGGGAWMGYGPEDAVMTVGGTTTITDNKDKDGKANNVDLRMGKSLTADASLSPFARIGITTLTSNEKTLVKNSTDTTVFTSDMSGYKLIDDGNSGLKLAVDDGSTPTQTGHKHYLCGKTHTEVGDHTSDVQTEFKAWTETSSLPSTKGNYYLENNVTLDDTWEPADGTVLCLNGHSITCTAGTNDEAISAISVESSVAFTLTDCSKDENGSNKGEITHSAGAIGRGVYNDGTFYLYGGNITGNNSGSKSFIGGGVMNDNGATFIMYGGRITNNIAEHGGGVYNSPKDTYPDKQTVFKMYGGKISGNQANRGGGVYNQCDFIMDGGTIGGIEAVDSNTATDLGGGVYLSSETAGTLTMKSGSIIGNAAAAGGGVFVDVNEAGTAISKLIVSGNANVTDNKANGEDDNVYLGKSTDETKTASIEIAGALTENARIGVTTAKTPTDDFSVDIAVNVNNSDASCFTSDNSDYIIAYEEGKILLKTDTNPNPPASEHKHCICGANHTETGDHKSGTQNEFTAWTKTDSLPDTAGSYYLTDNVTLTETWEPAEGTVLCLNGKTIIMQNSQDTSKEVDVIKITGHFTLTDCRTNVAQGKITHDKDSSGNKYKGKGIKVLGGTFDMFGGIISGNTTNYDIGGGGVSVEGVSDTTKASIFKLYGGKISGNTAKSGGGVHVRRTVWCGPSEFRMYGGSITNNNADSDAGSYGVGGGVYVSWTSKFFMSGGTISENTATQNGGGLYASALAKQYTTDSGGAATLNVSGNAAIKDNTVDSKKNNVYLDSSTININTVSATLTINNTLTGNIGITAGAEVPVTIATGADSNTDYSAVITSDNADYKVMHNSSNKSELMLVSTAAPEHHWSKEWSANDTYHWHECTDADCTEINDKEGHSGGTATCTEKAVCSVCNTPYGKVLGHEFGGKYKYSAAGHWQECQREGCTATGSITDHIYDNSSDVTCNICGYVRTVKPGTSGKTDNVINKAEDRNAGTAASTTATIKPSTTTSGEKKTTTATVDNTTANKILDKAVSNKSTEVIINTLTRAGISEAQAGTATEIALPEKTVRELSEKTEASLIIRADAAEITLDKKSVDGLAAQAGTDGYVRLIVEIVKQDSNTLEAELKLVTSKGTVTDFKGGNVSVMVKLNDTLAAKDLVCVYIDDSNIYHMVNGAKNSDGTYSFMTGHFSTYAVMARSEAEKVIAEQNADRATELVKSVKLKARSAKTAKGNIRVTLSVANGRDSIKELEDLGYTVKYKYYRSTSRAKNYKSMLEGTGKTYINTAGKKGTKYFYKARLTVYDAQGRLIAKTELKQCRYACRVK